MSGGLCVRAGPGRRATHPFPLETQTMPQIFSPRISPPRVWRARARSESADSARNIFFHELKRSYFPWIFSDPGKIAVANEFSSKFS